jgi:selenocysteine lyase/cysteine desulfurase
MPRNAEDLRREIVGLDVRVPVLDGTERPYIYLDNAASTPSFLRVLRCVDAFMPWYSGVHRGTGFKSLLATEAYDAAHGMIGRFVGADPSYHTVIFAKNTTECVNKLAARMALGTGDLVVATLLEHHSNDLPWRKHATVVYAGMLQDGRLDLDGLRRILSERAGRVRVVAVTGAANITGLCSPVREIARWAHAAGALLFVDAAQLAAHRAIEMGDPDDPSHIDFLALSAHKMYAPYGTGALIGPRAFFETGDPDMVGGGVVNVVTLEHAFWNHPPQKEEAGSPNVVGAIAMAEAAAVLQAVGMEAIREHEAVLLAYAFDRLRKIPGLRLYGPKRDLSDRVGVITFNLEGVHHSLVAAILGIEGGIGVRDGCFCAHPYVKELLGLSAEQDQAHETAVLSGDKTGMPGMVRASLGCYNCREDIDALVEMVGQIQRGEYKGRYTQDRASGAYRAEGFVPTFAPYFPYLDDFAVKESVRT